MKNIYRRIIRFKFENDYYQMFKSEDGAIAFLKNNEKEKYSYPTLDEFTKLIRIFSLEHRDNLKYIDNNHKKYSFIPKVKDKINGRVILIMLTSSLVLSTLSGCGRDFYTPVYPTENVDRYGLSLDDNYDYVYEENTNEKYENSDLPEDLLTRSLFENEDFELFNGDSKMIRFYNSKYFTQVFGRENYSLEELIDIAKNNKNITKEYLPYVIDFIETMYNYYPQADYRIFGENLKVIKFEIKSSDDLDFADGSLGYLDIEEMKMVLPDSLDLKGNGRGKIVFRHELGHMFTSLLINIDGYIVKYNFYDNGSGRYIDEALDTIFTTEPFLDEYDEELKENLGYPITTNIVRVLVDCMDYDIGLNRTNSIYGFKKDLDAVMLDDLDADIIDQLITCQWTEYSTDSIEIDEEEYIELYGYVTRLYIAKNINSNMTYDEIIESKNNFINKLTMGVKDPNMVYDNVIEDEFNHYLESNNIEVPELGKSL